eukprot:1153454-Rhodomonas_salina.1
MPNCVGRSENAQAQSKGRQERREVHTEQSKFVAFCADGEEQTASVETAGQQSGFSRGPDTTFRQAFVSITKQARKAEEER